MTTYDNIWQHMTTYDNLWQLMHAKEKDRTGVTELYDRFTNFYTKFLSNTLTNLLNFQDKTTHSSQDYEQPS